MMVLQTVLQKHPFAVHSSLEQSFQKPLEICSEQRYLRRSFLLVWTVSSPHFTPHQDAPCHPRFGRLLCCCFWSLAYYNCRISEPHYNIRLTVL